jgi:hypothetical protein
MYTNIGLVEHAKKALKEKWGYVYGTYGVVLNEQLLKEKLRQYPNNVCAYETFIRSNWMNRMVTDCVGLIKSYMWWNGVKAIYTSLYDVSANGMYERAKELDLECYDNPDYYNEFVLSLSEADKSITRTHQIVETFFGAITTL